MKQASQLERLGGHRAQLIEQMRKGDNAAILNLRLSCVEEEFRKEKAKHNSLFEKTRRAIEQLFEGS